MIEGRVVGGMVVAPLRDGTNSTGRVLVLEDNEDISDLWTYVLEGAGYQVVCHESAFGLAALLQHWCPDVILLDLGLPYRSGGALLADLKADPITATIPVIIVSGAPESLPRKRAALAAAVLTKPVPLQTLLAHVRVALAGKTTQGPPVATVAA